MPLEQGVLDLSTCMRKVFLNLASFRYVLHGRILWKHPTPQALPYTKTLVSSIHTHTHTFCSQSVIFEIWHPDYVLITGFLFHKGCCLNGSPKKKIDSTKETQLNNKKKASKLSFLAGNLEHCVYLVAKQFILYTLWIIVYLIENIFHQ